MWASDHATMPQGRPSALTRLAAMPGLKRLAGALAVAATAVAISACGSSSTDKTLTPEQANELTVALNGVETAVASGNCGRAEAMAGDFVTTVNALPETVGTEDKEALRSAGANLQKLAQDKSQCEPDNTGASGPNGVDTTTPAPTTTTPVPTTTDETTTTATTTKEPPPPPPSDSGGGSDTGGGPPSTPPGQTGGGGGDTGGGGAAGGGGGTGSGGTGGTGVGGGGTG